MPRGFTEKEKIKITCSLKDACKKSWRKNGYRKTSVDELCQSAGISKGAFYHFYDTKEALFCEIIVEEQNEICAMAKEEMSRNPHLSGVSHILKKIYRIYDENSFLYGSNPEDYKLLLEKLSDQQKDRLLEAQGRSRQIFLTVPNLGKRVEDDVLSSVIYSILMLNKEKKVLPCDHYQVFDFLADTVVQKLYEEG